LRCSVLTFEAGHRRLVGDESGTGRQSPVRVEEGEDTVTAEGHCGRASEKVTFVRLEAAKW
jgi:hypothetical protein